ncbi:hypothetical protein ACFPTR_07290 [Aliibacillus thermotolerans]|uniref:PaaD zinc beta ribbon domain-containing protein n=1 Tax=Aliibacillus thermotolerans TaxID=1834418 RepID=A0ABW0U7E6_9BACI|nr:hypothetical protein [Aliibacillus thermotolerans]MDA3129013.1 hypothetical protein [Aliibacillus thermotolerans]
MDDKDKIICSFCDSDHVSLYSPYGTAQLVRQFYCHDCKSVFEFIRWRNTNQDNHIEHSMRFIQH